MLIVIYLLALGVVDTIENECIGCCKNYTYNENNNSCDACPLGTYGNNCSSTCPPNYYGLFCNQKCDCKHGIICSPATGCLHPATMINGEVTTKDTDMNKDSCWKPQESKCCVDHYFNSGNESCDPCPPGKFGDNCSAPCPRGYYGQLCKQECNCSKDHCSPRTGCTDLIIMTTVEMITHDQSINKDSCWNPKESSCCWNYYFNRENNRCDPCPPGMFGDKCLSPCPPGYYGQFCKHECNCTVGIYCSPVTGCSNLITTTPCRTSGDNCAITCAPGYYGKLCKQKCNCSSGMYCSPKTGCTTEITRTNISDTSATITFLYVLAVIAVIFLLCLTACVFRSCRLWNLDMKHISQILRFKAPGSSQRRIDTASVAITNAYYTLAQQPSGLVLQETAVNRDDPMETAIGIYNEISLEDSIFLRRQTTEYDTLQLRFCNNSCNSFDFDTMEKNYKMRNLFARSDSIISEASHDMFDLCYERSGPAPEMEVSDHFKSKSGIDNSTLKVQVHTENENACYSKAKI